MIVVLWVYQGEADRVSLRHDDRARRESVDLLAFEHSTLGEVLLQEGKNGLLLLHEERNGRHGNVATARRKGAIGVVSSRGSARGDKCRADHVPHHVTSSHMPSAPMSSDMARRNCSWDNPKSRRSPRKVPINTPAIAIHMGVASFHRSGADRRAYIGIRAASTRRPVAVAVATNAAGARSNASNAPARKPP